MSFLFKKVAAQDSLPTVGGYITLKKDGKKYKILKDWGGGEYIVANPNGGDFQVKYNEHLEGLKHYGEDAAEFKVGDKVQNLIGTHGGIITRVGNNVIYYKCTWGNASEVGRELWMTKVEAKHTYQDGKIVSRDSVQDSDGKELRIGDKIKVQIDMHGPWEGGGVITALKPYGIVEYKDVFGHINTTQVNSVRRL